MEKFRESNKTDITVIITMSAFLLLGIILFSVGYGTRIASWFQKFGIVIIVISLPVLIYFIYNFVTKKIKRM